MKMYQSLTIVEPSVQKHSKKLYKCALISAVLWLSAIGTINAQSNDPIIMLPPSIEALPADTTITNESPRLAVEAAVYLSTEPKPDLQLAVKRFGASNTSTAVYTLYDTTRITMTNVVRVVHQAHWEKECAECGHVLKGVDRISRHFTDGGTNFQERVVTFQCSDGFFTTETYLKPLKKVAPMRRVAD